MSNALLVAPVYASDLIGAGRKNTSWFKIGVNKTWRGKTRIDKKVEDESKGYLIFEHCGVRQKRAIASEVDNMKIQNRNAHVFICHKCHRRVPVVEPLLIEITRTVKA